MKYIIAILLIAISQYTKLAAQITVNYSSSNYAISYNYMKAGVATAALLTPSEKPFSPKNPGFRVWFEYGDGKFTYLSNSQHGYIAPSQNAMVKITGIYENGEKPPPRIMSTTTGGTTNVAHQANYLKSGKNVTIQSNVDDICGNDTMHFAISYKVLNKQENCPKLVFEYNLDGIDCFESTKESQKITDVSGSETVNFIRTHFGETPDDTNDNKIIFSNLKTTTSATGITTVFVTLVPKNKEELEGTNCRVKAYLINCKGTTDEANSDEQEMTNKGDKPHDPNYILVNKTCLKMPTLDTALHYVIHFQNTGIGASNDSVKISTHIDPTVLSQINHNNTFTNLTAQYGNMAMTSFVPINLNTFTGPYVANTVYYDIVSHLDSVIFKIAKNSTILSGLNLSNPNFMDDPSTMGEITFNIKLPTNYVAGKQLNAQAGIVFDQEAAVLTNNANRTVVKKCKKTRSQSAPCNCKATKRNWRVWLREKCD